MPTVITSEENKIYKALLKLLDSRGMKKQERIIVAGAKIVRELAARRPADCCSLIIPERLQAGGMEDVVGQFTEAHRLIVLRRGLFGALDNFNTGAPLLEMRLPAIPEWDGSLAGQGCTLALPFQDPSNLGAVVRSAAGFGVREIVLLREATHPFHPKSIRASAGAVFNISFFLGPTLAEIPQRIPARDIVALDMHGEPISGFSFPDRFLLLPGMEGQGLPEELRGRSVSIPMSSAVESLNAAAAAAVALYCWSLQKSAPPAPVVF